MASDWISYNELAWTEEWLADPDECKDEAEVYLKIIKENMATQAATMLHLGCGAGGYDAYFKKYFAITGIDLSRGMLELARRRHPEIEYIEDDMRTVRLYSQFDVVAIPDSIDYMTTEYDLSRAIHNAVNHLKPGGILLIAAKTSETFRNNNFAYSGEKDEVNITLLENNYINPFKPNIYEASMMYLIRRKGELTIRTENQVLGLFPLSVWEKLFNEAGLEMSLVTLADAYKKYLLNEGEYPITVFIGRKVK